MASAWYPTVKQLFGTAGINLTSDTIKVALINTASYTYSSGHQFFSSITGVVSTPATLASKTLTLGVFDAADVTFSLVSSGSTITALVIYKDTGVAGTSPLIAYIDTLAGGATISTATNGGDIIVGWSNGTDKIFAI